ncbi:MAG: S8 family serine peptidase [Pseudomonadota bacterium]
MSKIRCACMALIAAAVFAAAGDCAAGGMDLMLRSILRNAASGTPPSKAMVVRGEEALVPCLIETRDAAATVAAVKAAGGQARAVTESIVSAYLPAKSAEEITSRSEVRFAEAALPLSHKMDTARAASGVDAVQSGSALGTAYNGKNVVFGDVDDALDYGNPDFAGEDGYTRVQYLQQALLGGTSECTKKTIADGSCGIEDGGQGTYHGTHVTGIGSGSNSTYTGVAPQADIMFIFIDPSDPDTTSGSFATTVLDGASKIFEKADAIDKAAVVNLSLGTSVGAHDGTSLLEQGLSQLTGAKSGRIIVNAAGNEQAIIPAFSAAFQSNIGGIHAPVSVAAVAGTSTGYRLAILNGSGVSSTYSGGTLIDLWLDAGQKDACSIAVYSYTNGRSTPDFTFPGLASTGDAVLSTGDIPFATSTSTAQTTTAGSVTASVEIDSSDARNSKPHAAITIAKASGASSSVLEGAWFDIVVRSSGAAACSGHMWLYYDYPPYHDFLKGLTGGTYDVAAGAKGAGYSLADGDSFYTTTIPATATGVIAAGSWMPPKPIGASSSQWTGDNGTTYDQSNLSAPGGTGSTTGDLSDFSSLGPTADGRTKPDVVAPGEPIISTKARDTAMSSSITVGGDHIKEAGTSMSSPHLAGIVALLLERNNTLGVTGVRTALVQGAHTSGMTSRTTDPANSYGAGKVDAASVLASVSVDTSAYHGTGDLESPSGGSSCRLAALHIPCSAAAASLAIALIPLLLARSRKKFLR